MSEPCKPGYSRINGVCVKNPTPPPPTLTEETPMEESTNGDPAEDEG